MGVIEHDKSKPQSRRDEYIAARVGKTENIFRFETVKLFAISFQDIAEDTDGLIKDGESWTELFALDGTFIARVPMEKFKYCGFSHSLYGRNSAKITEFLGMDTNKREFETEVETDISKILGEDRYHK